MPNLDRRAAPVAEPTNRKPDVLSESTDLDSLLVAILGEERQEKDDRAQLVATIDAQVAGVVQELGLDKLLAERRRAANAAARSTAGEPTPAAPVEIASTESVAPTEADTESAPAPSQSSRLRDVLARLFPLRTSVWLVVVLVGGAAWVTVSAISDRSRDQELPVARTTRTDVFLPAVTPQAALAAPASYGGTSEPGRTASHSAVAPDRRVTTRSLPASPQVATPRPQAGPSVTSPIAAVSTSKPPEDSRIATTAASVEPIAAPTVAYESRPVVETINVIMPSTEQMQEAEAMLVPLPAIITERPLVPTSASSAAAPSTRPVGIRRPARPLQRTIPDYPAAIRAAKIAGTVGVTFTIDKTGHPTNVHARSGPPPLRAVAEAAIQQWRYEPATLDDVAVDSEMTVQFTFGPPSSPRPE